MEADSVAEDQSGRQIDAAFSRLNDQHPGNRFARHVAGDFSGCEDRIPNGLI